jgi:hypothetical protein
MEARVRLALVLIAAAMLLWGLTAAQAPKGGIVPTRYQAVTVEPGPEPDVTFFATGDALGRIEPCG